MTAISACPKPQAATLAGVQVLVLDADPCFHASIERLLSEARLHVTCVAHTARALQLVERQFFSVALIDLDTPALGAGLGAIRMLKQLSPTSMVISMSQRPWYDDAIEAVRAGASDLILKTPASMSRLKDRVLDAACRSIGRRKIDLLLADMRGAHEDLLERFMESERRALDLADKAAGRAPPHELQLGRLRVLIVDERDELAVAMAAARPEGCKILHAKSGGEGLDRISSAAFHYVMVARDGTDLPVTTIARAIQREHPDTVVLAFQGPAADGKVELVEDEGARVLVKPFTDTRLLLFRLDELAEAWRARARERRYARAFHDRHRDFLRRYLELRARFERALDEGPG